MENHENQKTAKIVPDGTSKTEAAGAANGEAETAVLTVPQGDMTSELTQFCDELIAKLAGGPKQLKLRFVGFSYSPADHALIISEILATKRNGVTIITDAWSPVIGSSVLTWLAGDIRRIRKTAYLNFRSPLDNGNPRRRNFPWDDCFDLFAGDAEPGIDLAEQDYKTVLQLIDEYLPIKQMAGKIITPDMLKEFGLLENSPLDNLLKHCLSGDANA